MINRDRAIFGAAWALILAGIVVILGLAIHPIAATAAEPTRWQHVTAYCHRTHVCVPTPAVIRHADGIGPHAPSWTRYGDTTYTWVKRAHGTVQTYTS